MSIGLEWQSPLGCESNACVQTARDDEFVYVRHSLEPDGPMLKFTRAEWIAHEAGIIAQAQSA